MYVGTIQFLVYNVLYRIKNKIKDIDDINHNICYSSADKTYLPMKLNTLKHSIGTGI